MAALAEVAVSDPYAELGDLLAGYRRMGIRFDDAWSLARSKVAKQLRPGTYRGQRGEFYSVTGGTKGEWRKAYERTGRRLVCVEALRDALPDETETHPLQLVGDGDRRV